MSEQFTEMNKASVRRLDAELREVILKFAEDRGLKATVGGGKFDPTVGEFKPKVVLKLEGADRRAFEREAGWYGLEPEDFGKKFDSRGRTFRVTGINSRAQRFPIVGVEVRTGKSFKFSEDAVRSALGRDVIA